MTVIVHPVVARERSETRKATASATSDEVTGTAEQAAPRVEGLELVDEDAVRLGALAPSSSDQSREPAKIASGLITFARIPAAPPSSAAIFASCTSPALATEYGPKPAPGAKAFFEAM